MDDRVYEIATGVAGRLGSEPELDDFLSWTAGTLEYCRLDDPDNIAIDVEQVVDLARASFHPHLADCPFVLFGAVGGVIADRFERTKIPPAHHSHLRRRVHRRRTDVRSRR